MAASNEPGPGPDNGASQRRRRYVAGEPAHPITPIKLRLLLYIADCGLLSSPQVAAIAGHSMKSAYAHLRDLQDHGLVQAIGVPRAALAGRGDGNDVSLLYGSAPKVYAPTREGLRLLYDNGMIGRRESNRALPTYGPRNSLFLAHELEIRDVRVWLERLHRAHPGHEGLLQWNDGADAEIALGPGGGAGTPRTVRPDAWFVYGLRNGGKLAGFLEADRGTERGTDRWAQKFEAYARLFLMDGLVREVTGQQKGRVLVVTPDAARRDTLAEMLREWLEDADLPPDRFWLAERAALIADGPSTDLAAESWRTPGREATLPLVPARFR